MSRQRPPLFDQVRADVQRALSGRAPARTRQERLAQPPPAGTVIDPNANDGEVATHAEES